jgi:transcriptional regulator with XRE-family HTH domain
MHEFYARVQTVFQRAGSNRNQFCKKYGYSYQTLQAYWNTDKLPSGNVLEDLAREYHVSIDALVLGRSPPDVSEENPVIGRIVRFLRQQDEQSLLRIDGALQMFRYLALSGARPSAASGEPPDDVEIMPAKTEKASRLLAELAQLIRKSDMNAEEKKAGREMMSQVIQNIYEREVKDEWAELEEIE